MAAAVVSVSAVKQGVTTAGRRHVTATLDFDTGDYAANGIPLATTIAALGLRQIERARILCTPDVDSPYTRAQWVTANSTVTYGYFVDTASPSTPQAPRLVIHSAGAELGAVAVAASAQVRIRFEGH